MSEEKKNSRRFPLWMPLYVEKFLADTSGCHTHRRTEPISTSMRHVALRRWNAT